MHMKILIPVVLALFVLSCTVEKPVQESKILPAETPAAEAKTPESASAIKCRTDNDCGGRVVSGATNCWQGNVQGTMTLNRCVNPGKSNSYCTSEERKGVVKECSSTQFCKQGECLEYECSDTDGGTNFKEAGTVSLNDGTSYEDKCKDETTLTEYYCSSDNRQFSKAETCNCIDGACASDSRAGY